MDFYGRICPKHAHGTGNLDHWTSSTTAIMETMMDLYDVIMDPDLLIRRLNIVAAYLIPEKDIRAEGAEQLDLFTDYDELQRREEARKAAKEQEKKLQNAMLEIKDKFGKNAILKGTNYLDGATARDRNGQIGGHRS